MGGPSGGPIPELDENALQEVEVEFGDPEVRSLSEGQDDAAWPSGYVDVLDKGDSPFNNSEPGNGADRFADEKPSLSGRSSDDPIDTMTKGLGMGGKVFGQVIGMAIGKVADVMEGLLDLFVGGGGSSKPGPVPEKDQPDQGPQGKAAAPPKRAAPPTPETKRPDFTSDAPAAQDSQARQAPQPKAQERQLIQPMPPEKIMEQLRAGLTAEQQQQVAEAMAARAKLRELPRERERDFGLER